MSGQVCIKHPVGQDTVVMNEIAAACSVWTTGLSPFAVHSSKIIMESFIHTINYS